MTCDDAAPLLDAFVDSELEPQAIFDVARHAGGCARCGDVVNALLALRRALAGDLERRTGALDLAGVWPRLEARLAEADARASWRRRAEALRRRVPGSVPLWGSLAALAASAALFLRAPAPVAVANRPALHPTVERVATRQLPNHIQIDRLAGKDIALRREPKSGTTIIWVNHEVGDTTGW
jgi:anti-sigma factor RsiW